jgi:PAS domain S-box-containing protein
MHQNELNKSATVISEALWTLYTEAAESYLKQIVDDRSYKQLRIYTLSNDSEVFEYKGEALSAFEALLFKVGLIRTHETLSTVYYNDNEIGTMHAVVYNKRIYSYFYILLFFMLIITSVSFWFRLYDYKQGLEKMVRNRTSELKEQRERLNFALEAAHSGIWDWNLITGEVFFDDNYYKISGYKPNAFPSSYNEWKTRIHPEDADMAEKSVRAYLAGDTDYFSAEFRFLRADGNWSWILSQGKFVEYNSSGAPVRFIGIHIDIDHRKFIADRLAMSEERYASMFNNEHTVMLMVDHESGDILDANPAAVNYYGYQREELLVKTIYSINTLDKESLYEKMQQAAENIQNKFQLQHRLASGKVRDVEVNTGPVMYGDKKYILAVVQDITQRLIAEKELQDLNKTLKERVDQELDKNRKQEEIIHNQKKLADMGNMVSAISHQWRQPLNALGFYLQDVGDAYDNNDLDKDYLEKFEDETMGIVKHLSDTIDDFRYFFQPDKNAVSMRIIDEIFSLLRLTLAQLQNNHINVVLTCKCGEHEFVLENLSKLPDCDGDKSIVKGYRGEFKQVIANIIYNAIDAINSHRTPETRGKISIDIRPSEEKVRVAISDNGGGVSDDVAGKIFFPYFSTKPDSKGTGIGLYMSKVIIEEHMNGSLYFENIEDGACFIVELPRDSEKSLDS